MQPLRETEIDWKGVGVKGRIQYLLDIMKSADPDATWAQAKKEYARQKMSKHWANDTYHVIVDTVNPQVTHLSIKTHDRRPARDWRDFQEIKNQIVGPECEGIELYPAESRLVDSANQFHIWVINDPGYTFPFGFNERLVSEDEPGLVKQRNLDSKSE